MHRSTVVRRVLFRWNGITVNSYPAMLYIGLVTGVVAGNYAANVMSLAADRVFIATFALIIPALAGARLLYVATHWDRYRNDHSQIWNRSQGGAAQYGGLALAVPVSVPLLSALQLPFGAFWDIASITMLVGMIFTRVGCLMNGCCAGRPSDVWGSMYLPNHLGVWAKRVPAQILEAAWASALLAGSLLVWPRLPFQGALFVVVVAGYASGRLFLESTRDSRFPGQSFTINHGISLLLIALSIATLAVRGLM